MLVDGVDGRRTREGYFVSEAKRRAQDALFTAIADQAETNMKSALRAPEKAALLHELAETYRLTAGTTAVPNMWTARDGQPEGDAERMGATPPRWPTASPLSAPAAWPAFEPLMTTWAAMATAATLGQASA
jgi:hypothetical protein